MIAELIFKSNKFIYNKISLIDGLEKEQQDKFVNLNFYDGTMIHKVIHIRVLSMQYSNTYSTTSINCFPSESSGSILSIPQTVSFIGTF